MTTTQIRLVNQRDPVMAEAIYQLQQRSYAVERDLIDYPEFPPLRVTAVQIQQEPDTFLGAWDVDHLVGILSYITTSEVVEINRLIVHPDAFRRGIGRTLLTYVEAAATTQHVLTVSTAEKNTPAVLLYQSHGYQLHQRTVLPDGLVLVAFRKSLR